MTISINIVLLWNYFTFSFLLQNQCTNDSFKSIKMLYFFIRDGNLKCAFVIPTPSIPEHIRLFYFKKEQLSQYIIL